MLDSGVVLSNRYRLDERVATGGMGDVWRATDQVLGRRVAVKVLLPALLTDPTFIARFRAEARMMAALHHPGIVQVFDCGEDPEVEGGRADYLVMEYVDGEPLSRRIDATGKLGVEETLSVVAQAAEALHAAHANGIVHRDVKPSNLLVQEDGTVVLVDFGVARSTNVTSVTSADAVPGTVLYMAPEQASGQPVSGATDIYALGAVAYCCLAGTPPFVGDNPLEVAVKHLHEEPPPLPEQVPPAVAALVFRALAKKPEERFPDAAAFASAARAAVTDPESEAAPTAVVGAGGAGAAAAGAVAGSVRAAGPAGADPSTLTDMPVVVATPGRSEKSRRRMAALTGALAAAVLGTVGLIAALGFTGDEPGQPSGPVPSSAPVVKPVTGPSSRETTQQTAPQRGSGNPTPSRPTTAPSTTPSSAPTGSPSAAPTSSPDEAKPSSTQQTTGPSPTPSEAQGGTPTPDPLGSILNP